MKAAHPHNRRPAIGLLMLTIEDTNGASLWAGVVDAAQAHDINLICFPGRGLCSPAGFDSQHNIVYELVSAETLDGLIVWTSGIGTYVTRQEMLGFCQRYGLPAISFGDVLEGIPSIVLDSYHTMREIVTHLIEHHGRRRLALVRGPAGHREAETRYKAYADALMEYMLPVNQELIVGPIQWDMAAEALSILLDQRNLRPGDDFDAIVASSDLMALSLLEGLQTRGIHVPYDVALVGFDDRADGRFVNPPLTTASNRFYERGQRAVEMLLTLIRGEQVPERIVVPAQLIVRQSCGCLGKAVTQAAVRRVVPVTGEPFQAAVAARRDGILAAMALAVGDTEATTEWMGLLLDAFIAEIGGSVSETPEGSPGIFLPQMDKVLRQVVARGGDVSTWHGALSALRCQTLPYLSEDRAACLRAEDLWQQARTLIGEMAGQSQTLLARQSGQHSLSALQIGQSLTTTSTMEQLADALVQELGRLNIPRCYLALYEDSQPYKYPLPAPKWSRLVLAYNGVGGQSALEAERQRFPTRQLLPKGILPQDERYSLVAKPLFFRDKHWGFVLFEAGPGDTGEGRRNVYETLRGEISGAMQGLALIAQVENRLLLIQAAAEISQVAGSILDPDELMYRIVELVQERFGLYYAGLFLIASGEPAEGASRWAYLQAGTGDAGRQMVKQRYRLEVGGRSMIGQCIATGKPRIALDVGQEPVRFSNPLLPETRSELALPLISRGEVIGALTIQSSKEAAFGEEDIAIFQLMAGLLANIVENAHLFKQTQEALKELEAIQRLYVRDTWSRYIARHPGQK